MDGIIQDYEKKSIAAELGVAAFVVASQMFLKFGIATTALVGSALLIGGQITVITFFMTHLKGITAENIAELGCGGGRNTAEPLKRYPQANVTALDYFALSVEKTKEYNKDMIATGRCTVIQIEQSHP